MRLRPRPPPSPSTHLHAGVLIGRAVAGQLQLRCRHLRVSQPQKLLQPIQVVLSTCRGVGRRRYLYMQRHRYFQM